MGGFSPANFPASFLKAVSSLRAALAGSNSISRPPDLPARADEVDQRRDAAVSREHTLHEPFEGSRASHRSNLPPAPTSSRLINKMTRHGPATLLGFSAVPLLLNGFQDGIQFFEVYRLHQVLIECPNVRLEPIKWLPMSRDRHEGNVLPFRV